MTEPIIQSITQPDVLSAVHTFIREMILPPLDAEAIIRGWENRASLPSDGNEYCVYSILSETRCGSNVHEDGTEPADNPAQPVAPMRTVIRRLMRCGVQLAFSSDSDNARVRAGQAELLAHDEIGCAFFHDRGITCLGADALQDSSGADASRQYVKRFTTVLHLAYWAETRAQQPGFNAVNVHLENVDVRHPA